MVAEDRVVDLARASSTFVTKRKVAQILIWVAAFKGDCDLLLFRDLQKFLIPLCIYVTNILCPKWSTNPIAITRIFPHWPMGFTL